MRRRAGLLVAAAPLLVACGSRTGIDVSLLPADASPAADGSPAADASPTADAPDDAGARCRDGGPLELAYVFDADGVLLRYDPLTGQSERLGAPDCGNDNVPWTMTASSENAYIVYTDWTIYRVSLATLACTPTPFQPGQLGLDAEFGVAAFGSGPSERLFVYGLPSGGSTPILAVSDTSSFVLSKIGDIVPVPPLSSFPVNLTADANGNLYAFSPGGLVQKIDSATGAVLQAVDTNVTSESTWATLTYGADLYLWVESRVDGYDLAARARTSDRDAGILAIGAGSFLACPGG
jgi:hypothetical protein